MRPQLRFVVVVGLILGAVVPARAQWSSASVFTEDGVELGVEPRLFALYAILNGAGYDVEVIRGPLPLERPKYSVTREKLRQNVGRTTSPELLKLIEKNPVSVQEYAAAVLELGPAPRFDDKAATSPLAKALAPSLREWFNEEGGSALLRNANEEARATQKRLLPALDAAIKGTTKLVRLGDSSDQLLDDAGGATGRVAIVINDLDAAGTLFVLQAKDTTGIIAGPSRGAADDDAILDAAVFAYAKTLVATETAKVAAAGTLIEGYAKLGEPAQKALVDEKGYARTLLACTVAREIRKRPLACGVIDKDPEGQAALALIAPRMVSYATTTALLSAAMGDLFAPPPPPPPPEPVAPEPPKEEPKKKGKKGSG
ncbi:MAG: hypothetical protein Q8O67_21890 [Deltaproteobacteria bacterium]|nr:hypothetical protein [Deltaproteobacteria bacterium]